MTTYEAVIGLEVHAQLLTKTKAFCSCSTQFGGEPNTQTCPVCLGLPGALPVLNARAVELAIRAGLSLDCTIRETSRFARKNYFYPDLPKGYQISQFDEPLCEHGVLELHMGEGDAAYTRTVRIQRIHMEEDAGKNLHDRGDDSIVDLNRSGTPLIETVSDPDLRSAAEASEYLRTLRDIFVFAGVNDGNLEEGSFRCDANVSIRPVGTEKFGTRVELKNINSFRFVEKAIIAEIKRQEECLRTGERIVQETRGWNDATGTTYPLRSKEEAQDYRYFPEPDLPPLVVTKARIDAAKAALPERPREKRARYVSVFGLTPYAAGVLTGHPRVAAFFEAAVAAGADATKASNFIQAELLRDVKTKGVEAEIPLTPEQLLELLALVDAGTISGKQAKEVYAALRGTLKTAKGVVGELGLEQMSDAGAIDAIVQKIVDANPKQAEQLRGGKLGLMGFFVGQTMKETGGSANPALVNAAIKKVLGLP
jgi:aspartyl-tRNA(Asn)/glutamyl-tRNA(Gln) amidotransferase subunit B